MNTQAFQIKEKLAQLEQALVSSSPNMASLLREIHKHLKSDPDVVTILTEDDCAVLVRGLKKQTSADIATKAIAGTRAKSAKNLTLEDL